MADEADDKAAAAAAAVPQCMRMEREKSCNAMLFICYQPLTSSWQYGAGCRKREYKYALFMQRASCERVKRSHYRTLSNG